MVAHSALMHLPQEATGAVVNRPISFLRGVQRRPSNLGMESDKALGNIEGKGKLVAVLERTIHNAVRDLADEEDSESPYRTIIEIL